MRFAFLMDPLSTVKPHKDTSYFLMLAAFERGHEIFHVDQDEMFLQGERLFAKATPVEVHADPAKPFAPSAPEALELASMDVIFVRKDPPFDRRYLYTTLLLDMVGPNTLVLNAPSALRNWNEKLSALFYPRHTPKTLVSADPEAIWRFVSRHGRAVVKPVDGHGGRGIFFADANQAEESRLRIARVTEGRKKIIVQEFVEEAAQGDKRILLADGEPIGAVLRVAPRAGGLNNLDQGGKAVPAEITEHENALCRELAVRFKREGLFFVGIDLLGPYLTEINVTSPTGLQEMAKFSGKPLHHDVIERIEKKKK